MRMNHLDTQRKHSIFDDVLGPIMSGPSSSHSAGCARIGKMTQLLYGREISHAEAVFEENGAYPETYPIFRRRLRIRKKCGIIK